MQPASRALDRKWVEAVPDPTQWLAQRHLLATLPSSAQLRKSSIPRTNRTLRVQCDRSLPFELIDDFLNPFLATWGADHRIDYSSYDPGLSQLAAKNDAPPADLQLIFLDWRLYRNSLSPKDAARWIGERAQSVLDATGGRTPVLLNNWPTSQAGSSTDEWTARVNAELRELAARLPGLTLVDLENIRGELSEELLDPRNDAVARFPFSWNGAVAIARHLALDLFPPLCGERIKAIVLDLDDTLWGGVLGEEGPRGIAVQPGHRQLQHRLKELATQGVMLALCSRNELVDVERVFLERTDLGLSLQDFASIRVNWAAKADNLREVARDLNILPASMLFVDDNPAELARAVGAIAGLRVLLAEPGGAETARALRHFPGLFALSTDAVANLRTADVRANRQREAVREQSADLAAYLAALKMEIDLHQNWRPDAQRLHQLSQKTNQFNLALARLSVAEAESSFGPDRLTMTISLRDALSDSGLIGAIVARLEGDVATFEEVLFSCRILGREVETAALARFCQWLETQGIRLIRFTVAEGPRNQPARDWLRRFVPEGTEAELADFKERLAVACRAHTFTVREHIDESTIRKAV